MAYNFLNDSGITNTANTAGYTSQKLFGKPDSLVTGIGFIISIALSFLGVIFLGLTIYGGILWMTAEGDESKVEKAQTIIRNAVIGLIITLAAYAISFFVINALA